MSAWCETIRERADSAVRAPMSFRLKGHGRCLIVAASGAVQRILRVNHRFKGSSNIMRDSHEATKARRNVEELSAIVVDCGYKLHVEAGPGLLESVYEVVLARMLAEQGLRVRRQVPVTIRLLGMTFDEGFRADLLIEDRLLVELKSVESLAAVHGRQVLTYLRLLNLPLGLLINFGAPTFKEGCKRIVNGPQSFVSSCLRVNQFGNTAGLETCAMLQKRQEFF
jgi:GxxExxY protein